MFFTVGPKTDQDQEVAYLLIFGPVQSSFVSNNQKVVSLVSLSQIARDGRVVGIERRGDLQGRISHVDFDVFFRLFDHVHRDCRVRHLGLVQRPDVNDLWDLSGVGGGVVLLGVIVHRGSPLDRGDVDGIFVELVIVVDLVQTGLVGCVDPCYVGQVDLQVNLSLESAVKGNGRVLRNGAVVHLGILGNGAVGRRNEVSRVASKRIELVQMVVVPIDLKRMRRNMRGKETKSSFPETISRLVQ